MNKEAIRQRLIEELNLNTDNLFTNLLSHALAWHERTKELKADLAHSADTIAALKKDAERLDWLDKHPREATIRVGTDMKACVFYGVSCDPKWTMREAIDAAIDAAQSTEGER